MCISSALEGFGGMRLTAELDTDQLQATYGATRVERALSPEEARLRLRQYPRRQAWGAGICPADSVPPCGPV